MDCRYLFELTTREIAFAIALILNFQFVSVFRPGYSFLCFHTLCGFRHSFFLYRFVSDSVLDLGIRQKCFVLSSLPRKEVIQPHLPIRLPCYDFTPVIGLTFDGCLLAVNSPASGAPNSHGVTGGVYKARERIHRGMLIRDY